MHERIRIATSRDDLDGIRPRDVEGTPGGRAIDRNFANRASRHARRIALVGGGVAATVVALAARQEEAVLEMEAALRTNGDSVDAWSRRLQSAAGELQNMSGIADDQILSLFAVARNYGIAADEMEEMTKKVLGLQQATGGRLGLTESLRAVVFVQKGLFGEIQQTLPVLRTFKTDAEKLAFANKLMADGFEQVQARMSGSRGALVRIKNDLGDFGEELGNILLPHVVAMIDRVRSLLPVLADWVTENRALLVSTGRVVAIVGTLLILLPQLVAAIRATVIAVNLLRSSMVLLGAHPIVAAIIAVATAIAAIVTTLGVAKSKADELRSSLNKLGETNIVAEKTAEIARLAQERQSLLASSELEPSRSGRIGILREVVSLNRQSLRTAQQRAGIASRELEFAKAQRDAVAERIRAAGGAIPARGDAFTVTPGVSSGDIKQFQALDNIVREMEQHVIGASESFEEMRSRIAELEQQIKSLENNPYEKFFDGIEKGFERATGKGRTFFDLLRKGVNETIAEQQGFGQKLFDFVSTPEDRERKRIRDDAKNLRESLKRRRSLGLVGDQEFQFRNLQIDTALRRQLQQLQGVGVAGLNGAFDFAANRSGSNVSVSELFRRAQTSVTDQTQQQIQKATTNTATNTATLIGLGKALLSAINKQRSGAGLAP